MSECKVKTSRNTVAVYVAQFPFDTANDCVSPLRAEEIASCANEQTRKSKYYVWKLLEYAFDDLLGVDLNSADVVRTDNGKWVSSVKEFSLAHSNDVVAVALSDKPVGIDVEACCEERFDARLQERILTECERARCNTLPQNKRALYTNCLWTVKEALFKRDGGKTFSPSKIESESAHCISQFVSAASGEYILSVASMETFDVDYRCMEVSLGKLCKFD